MISYQMISYHIRWHHLISYDVISYDIISYDIISYHIISYHMISYHMISYDIIWYHIISYDIIWYVIIWSDIISAAAAAAAAAAADLSKREIKLFSGTFPWKNDLQKNKKYKKEPRENSVHFPYWIITRSFFSNRFRLLSIFKENRFFVSGLAIHAFTPPISLQSGEPRTLKHSKNTCKITVNFRSGARCRFYRPLMNHQNPYRINLFGECRDVMLHHVGQILCLK